MAPDTLKQTANKIRREVITMLYEEKKCHVGSNMSVIEILTALYFSVMKENDIFISSKGHCAAALFTTLQERGIINNARKYFKQHNLISHEVPGVLFSGGSLGQGLSVAAGMALADRTRKVFCLIGDGEMQEGNVWEAVWFAAKHELENLIVLVDCNGLQAFGEITDVFDDTAYLGNPFGEILSAFGWQTDMVGNGHDIGELVFKFAQACIYGGPVAVSVSTIKGKGVEDMENKLESHYLNINKKQYEEAIRINSN